MDGRSERLKELPKIDELLADPVLAGAEAPRWAVLEAARRQVEELRQGILSGQSSSVAVDVGEVVRLAEELARPSLRRVVNATGVVLHTNLGRAPLPAAAVEAVVEAATGYSNLEYDLDAGARGSRHGHLGSLVGALFGAEDAVVVNNNAGAVMLALAALAHGREVVVSRGELIEIGGSFRIPDVMRLSGATLREVGTTNKTWLRDYEAAIGDDTALLLKVHRSNFEMVGFTEEVGLEEMVELARRRGVRSMLDLGSGTLLEPRRFHDVGLAVEPSVQDAIKSGVDIVAFSGDKLLGGPQAGIIAGRADAVSAARSHPLMRALRPDKMTIAALTATLALYRDGRDSEVPAVAMLGATAAEVEARARGLAARLTPPEGVVASVVPCHSTVGGGCMPTAELPSFAIALTGRSARSLDRGLRAAAVPVVGRIADDRLLLDLRTVAKTEEGAVALAVSGL